jgi:hypothetical protein
MEQIDNTSRKYQLDLSILPNNKDISRFSICDKTFGTHCTLKIFNMLSKNLTRGQGKNFNLKLKFLIGFRTQS